MSGVLSFETIKHLQAYVPTAAALVGLAGGVLALGKTVRGALTDRSLGNDIRRHMQNIHETLARLRRSDEMKEAVSPLSVDSYRAQLLDDLKAESRSLERARAGLVERKGRRLQEPIGVRKWLLWFRPEGIAGWFVQSLFYGLIFIAAFLAVHLAFNERDILTGVGVVIEYLIFAGYVGSVATIHRHTKVLALRLEVPNPNLDLPWWKKLLQLFSLPPGGEESPAWEEPLKPIPDTFLWLLYYGWLVLCAFALGLAMKENIPLFVAILVSGGLLIPAPVFAIHRPSRRALAKLVPVQERGTDQALHAQ
jgi:hypothetical protein